MDSAGGIGHLRRCTTGSFPATSGLFGTASRTSTTSTASTARLRGRAAHGTWARSTRRLHRPAQPGADHQPPPALGRSGAGRPLDLFTTAATGICRRSAHMYVHSFPLPEPDVTGYDYMQADQPVLDRSLDREDTMNDILEPLCRALGINLVPARACSRSPTR